MAPSGKWIEGICPTTKVEDAARRSLELRLAAVAHCLPLAAHLAEHDIEHVHRLRVATRRAVAALKLYRDLLAGKAARWMKKRLRKIRRAAGDARDLDVLAKRLNDDYGERVAPIVELIQKERAAVQPAINEIADRCRRDDKFVRKTSKLLSRIRLLDAENNSHPPIEFCNWAAAQLTKAAAQFLDAMPDEKSDVLALHQFRIRGKALRYAIELVASAFTPELREDVYPIVEELQERLGKVQDHVTARQRFETWASGESDESRRHLLDELVGQEVGRLTDEIRDFHRWWNDGRVHHIRSFLETPLSETCSPATCGSNV